VRPVTPQEIPSRPREVPCNDISEAHITFRDVDELNVSMNWSGGALNAQVAAVRILKTRTTPNGRVQPFFGIEFADKEAGIEIALVTRCRENQFAERPVLPTVQVPRRHCRAQLLRDRSTRNPGS
jgi:hypothetical protein